MERKLFTGLTAPLFFAALVGCTNPASDGNTSTPDETGVELITYMVTLHASIDDVVITDEPPAVSVHETEGATGSEDVLATGTTQAEIPVDVPETGETVRPWVGPSSAEKTADGYRIYERDGFHYVHELADFPVVEDCEDTVELNVMPAVENTNYNCVGDKVWNASGESSSDGHHEFVQQFVAQEGKYFMDPDGIGFDGLFGAGEGLVTTGTRLYMHNPFSGDYDAEVGSEVREDGFTIIVNDGDATFTLTCVKQ